MNQKIKTKKSAQKRFKVSATGKISHNRIGKRHLLGKKSANPMRAKKASKLVNKRDVKAIKELLVL